MDIVITHKADREIDCCMITRARLTELICELSPDELAKKETPCDHFDGYYLMRLNSKYQVIYDIAEADDKIRILHVGHKQRIYKLLTKRIPA